MLQRVRSTAGTEIGDRYGIGLQGGAELFGTPLSPKHEIGTERQIQGTDVQIGDGERGQQIL